MKFIFVGEKRSNRAIEMDVTWNDGRLAAKTLIEALNYCGIPLDKCSFVNLWTDDGELQEIPTDGVIVGMGKRVQNQLKCLGIHYIPIIHPAARGKIRKHELYLNHVKESLESVI